MLPRSSVETEVAVDISSRDIFLCVRSVDFQRSSKQAIHPGIAEDMTMTLVTFLPFQVSILFMSRSSESAHGVDPSDYSRIPI